MTVTPARREAPGDVQVIRLGVWFALVASAGELVTSGFVWFVLQRPIQQPPGTHLLWMVPTANVVTFLVPALVLVAVRSVRPSAVSRRTVLSVFAGLAVLAVLLMLHRHLHWMATVALSAGIGLRIGSWLARHDIAFRRLVRLTLPAACAAVLTTAVTLPLARAIREELVLRELAAASPGAPNVVLIILDTVRRLEGDAAPGARPVMPALARWAREGVSFEQAISPAPWTRPSHASMFTGRWVGELRSDGREAIGPEQSTLAQALMAHGYATAGFVANRLVNRASGLSRGFAHFDVFSSRPSQVLFTSTIVRTLLRRRGLRRILHVRDTPGRRSTSDLGHAFLQWTEQHRENRPYFAFLNLYDAHAPYLPPPPYDTLLDRRGHDRVPALKRAMFQAGGGSATVRSERAAYLGAIAWADAQLGMLLDEMQARGMLRNTIVIISADHGEELGEHGRFGHGHTLYRELLSVPLVVIAPGRVPGNVRVARAVSLVDVAATILDLANVAAPGIGGRSWRDAWEGRGTGAPAWSSGVESDDRTSVIVGRFHFIRGPGSTEHLFDMRRDPGETHDLIGDADVAPVRDRMRVLVELSPDARAHYGEPGARR